LSQSQAGIKINEAYLPALESSSRYLVMVGTAGSGKSVFASQKIILRTLTERGHRFLVMRKFATNIYESVFKRLKNEIADLGLTHEFEINQTRMSFKHYDTGNEILTAGLDDVEKIKSIEKITGIWIEEATQVKEADFDQMDLRIRGEMNNYKQIILTFNPVDERNWLKKRFFDNHVEDSFCIKTTFRDNDFLTDEDIQTLKNKASVSPNIYRIYYLGEWGREDIESPYCINFKPEKHVSGLAQFRPDLPVIFSLDFNVEPFVCIASHIWVDIKGPHCHVFDEIVIEKNGDVYKMCDRLIDIFGPRVMANCLVTGDATSRKREVTQKENINAWRIMDTQLRLGKRLMVPASNPKVKESRHLVNAIMAYHSDFKISPDCSKLIYDCQFVEVDSEGDIIKKDRNKEAQRSDALDCLRYLYQTFMPTFIDQYKIK